MSTPSAEHAEQEKARRRLSFATRPRLCTALLAGAHAVLTILAFPPIGLWWLAFLIPAPLIIIAMKTPTPRHSALVVWVVTIPMWLFEQRWLVDVTIVGYPLLALYLSLFAALFVWLGALSFGAGRGRRPQPSAARVLLAAPLTWTAVEMLRGAVLFHGYPWFLAAHPTIEFTALASVASILGAYGVGFLVAMVGAALALAATAQGLKKAAASLGVATVVIFAGALAGALATASIESVGSVRVAAIQTNVPQSNKIGWSIEQRLADFARFVELTREAAAASPAPDLIIWPETMFPGVALDEASLRAERAAQLRFSTSSGPVLSTYFADELAALQQSIGIPLLVGAIAYDDLSFGVDEQGNLDIESDARFNSAFVIAGGRALDSRYDKIHLTPFGEVMPYISWSERLENLLLSIGAAGMTFDLEAGERASRLTIPGAAGQRGALHVAAPICFEVTMPAVCRRLTFDGSRRRAGLLVNLTNDGWFGRFVGGRRQHLQVARWRSVELATPMVRAANTGVSAAIDARGRLIAAGPSGRQRTVDVDGVMPVSIDLPSDSPTIYARLGDILGWASLIGVVPLILLRAGGGAATTQETETTE